MADLPLEPHTCIQPIGSHDGSCKTYRCLNDDAGFLRIDNYWSVTSRQGHVLIQSLANCLGPSFEMICQGEPTTKVPEILSNKAVTAFRTSPLGFFCQFCHCKYLFRPPNGPGLSCLRLCESQIRSATASSQFIEAHTHETCRHLSNRPIARGEFVDRTFRWLARRTLRGATCSNARGRIFGKRDNGARIM
jgi:hypothetical protein